MSVIPKIYKDTVYLEGSFLYLADRRRSTNSYVFVDHDNMNSEYVSLKRDLTGYRDQGFKHHKSVSSRRLSL